MCVEVVSQITMETLWNLKFSESQGIPKILARGGVGGGGGVKPSTDSHQKCMAGEWLRYPDNIRVYYMINADQ